MFQQALQTTFRILAFRAGPEDMPYSADLTRVLLPAAVVANFWVFSMALPLAMAVAMAFAMVGGMALATHGLLRARGLQARYQQTFSALLAVNALLTLLLIPPFSQVAPAILEAAKNPELLQDPEQLKLPQGAVLLMNLLNFWNFGVNAHILRNAMNVNLLVGILLTLVMMFIALFAVLFGGSLAASLLA